ncbi:MAG: RloB domain-containing protein [Saprospiraceae bacterium]|nr:RloB domain-containing protein [Saprospiraceae bacterium]
MAEISPYIKIICEGLKTEPNYFNGWLRANGYVAPNPASKAKDNSPRGVVKEAKQVYQDALKIIKIPPDKIHVWAVFDRDSHAGLPEAIDEARNSKINFAFSNVCFEFWLLLHFERTTKAFAGCDEIIDFIRQYHDADYGKSNDHYARLKNRISKALENGEWLVNTHWQHDERPIWEKNPYSDVHEMMNRIKGIL